MTDVEQYEQWCAQRHAAVMAPAGNLALVAFQVVDGQWEDLEGFPARVRRPEGALHLEVEAKGADEVRIDGVLVDGTAVWPRLGADGSGLLTCGSLTADAFSLDGSVFEARIYDGTAANRSRFDHIERHPFNPDYVVSAVFEPAREQEVGWSYSRASDEGARKVVPGQVRFTLHGQELTWIVFEDGAVLVVVFADGTTGSESYAPGRFLKFDRPTTGEFVLDLNQAFIPPCGFSEFYSCPLPPPQNRTQVPVRAGETRVCWKD